jgi:hypothetical protein
VVGEDTTTNMRFLCIDCGPLKQALVSHSESWVQKFTGLLNQLALHEARAIHEYMHSTSGSLARVPTTLEQLADAVNLHKRAVEDKKKFESRFDPLRCDPLLHTGAIPQTLCKNPPDFTWHMVYRDAGPALNGS